MKSKFISAPGILLLLLTSAYSGFTQEEASDAVYNKIVKEYTLYTDGSWDFHYSHSLKLLTYYSFHTLYGEDFIVYDPLYQKLKINRSNTTMADGKLVVGPENALNEVLPGYAANGPAFNHLREMVVTHTGLERGAVIDFDYTLSSVGGFSPFLAGNEQLWFNSPVKELQLIIHLPKGAAFNYEQFNIESKPLIVKSSSGITYSWSLRDLPAAAHEDFRLKETSNRPRVIFSSAGNVEKLIRNFTSQPAFALEADEVLSARVASAVKNEYDELKKMLAVQDIVVNEINYFAVPTAINGYRVRTSSGVFAANGGNEVEKAILLATALKVAGFQAEPVVVFPGSTFSQKSGNLLLAEKYLVKVTSRSMMIPDPVYLSPLQNDMFDQALTLNDKVVVSLLPSISGKIYKIHPVENAVELSGSLELEQDLSLKGEIVGNFRGRQNPYFKLSQDSAYCKKMLAGLFEAKDIRKGVIDKLEEDGSNMSFSITSLDKVKMQDGHYFVKIPAVSSGVDGWHMTELLSRRSESLEIPFLVKENYRFSITLPDGFVLTSAETSMKIKHGFGEFRIELSQEGKTIQVEKEIRLDKTRIDLKDYDDFKAFINCWNNKKYRELIIQLGPK